jgi:radical SAM protein with 4Fe4S-binding SPASM domain
MKAKELDPEKVEILTVDAPQDGIYILKKLEEENSPEYGNALRLLEFVGDSCSAGDRIANVDPSGNVYVCQFAQLAELKVGNIRQQKFSEIWKDEVNPILSTFRNKVRKLKGKCGKCAHKQLCGGGCRIRAYFQYGDLWAEDPLCPF